MSEPAIGILDIRSQVSYCVINSLSCTQLFKVILFLMYDAPNILCITSKLYLVLTKILNEYNQFHDSILKELLT